ncbi:MAG TPA: NUDIX domain-containing protein [Devosiaceae bacterium]
MLSAGILLYRGVGEAQEVLLVHPGGPFWTKKDDGAWSIPKGLCEPGEDPLLAAQREFTEETGAVAEGPFLKLGRFRLASGKVVAAWACRGNFDPAELKSNSFELEWPPRSGRIEAFPEVDRAAWFDLRQAREKLNKGQVGVLEALAAALAAARSA